MSPAAIVTGASGFVGRALMARLPHARGLSLGPETWRKSIEAASWRDATVFHLAARVHQRGADEALYDRDNVQKTVAVAEAAVRGGARRIVFLSTIKVNGEETHAQPFRPDDPPAPPDAYARSKWNAEQALRATCGSAGLPFVVVRSPLVVGPLASGNLRALLRIAASRCPLPFASLHNRRTLVAVDDLAALLAACAEMPAVEGDLLLAGDPHPVSTARLVAVIRAAWSRPPALFPMSASVLEAAAALFGQSERIRRLTRSLEIDVSQTLRDVPWTPAIPIEDAIRAMALAHSRRSRADARP